MPTPTLFGAGLGQSLAGSSLLAFPQQAIGDIASVAMTTAVREGYYQANWSNPNVVPSPEIIFNLWHRGRIGEPALRSMLLYNGIRLPASFDSQGQATPRDIWLKHLHTSGRVVDPLTLLHWFWIGLITRNEFEHALDNLGFGRNAEERDKFIGQKAQFTAEEASLLHVRGLLPEADYLQRLGRLGYDAGDRDMIRRGLSQPLGIQDAVTLWLRGEIIRGDLDDYLSKNGIINDADQRRMVKLARSVPSPSDLIYLSVKEAFDSQAAAANQYDAEFPAEFATYMGWQGYGWSPSEGQPDGDATLTWARLYWRAHWRPLAPEQAYRMLHRIRGDPEDSTTWRVPGLHPFTTTMLDTALKINDFAPGVREYLRAISYTPLRLIDIRQALRLRLEGKDRAWAVEQFQDRGHTLADSETQADIAVALADVDGRKERERNATAGERNYVAAVIRSYKAGILDRATARTRLVDRHHTTDSANLKLDTADLQEQEGQVQAAIRRSRADFMGGRDTAQGVTDRITSAGIGRTAAERLVRLWGIQRGEGKRLASTEKIIQWLHRGFITPAEATRRLTNLGWSQADMMLLGQDLMYDINAEGAKIQAALGKAQATAAKELQRGLEKLAAQQKSAVAELRRLTPPAKLLHWYETGLLSRAGYTSRMLAMQYPMAVISLNLAEADQRIRLGKVKV